MTKLCFIDTETTGLDRRRRQIWDFACIVRDTDHPNALDVEHQFFIDVCLDNADPFALDIGHFWSRYPGHPAADGNTQTKARTTGLLVSPYQAAQSIFRWTAKAVWIGAVPSFDEETTAKMLRRNGLIPRWDYHLVDVETAGGALAGIAPPWKNDVINGAYNIVIPPGDRHTALGDARAVRDLYDAIFKP